jgi:hypothetical protein
MFVAKVAQAGSLLHLHLSDRCTSKDTYVQHCLVPKYIRFNSSSCHKLGSDVPSLESYHLEHRPTERSAFTFDWQGLVLTHVRCRKRYIPTFIHSLDMSEGATETVITRLQDIGS